MLEPVSCVRFKTLLVLPCADVKHFSSSITHNRIRPLPFFTVISKPFLKLFAFQGTPLRSMLLIAFLFQAFGAWTWLPCACYCFFNMQNSCLLSNTHIWEVSFEILLLVYGFSLITASWIVSGSFQLLSKDFAVLDTLFPVEARCLFLLSSAPIIFEVACHFQAHLQKDKYPKDKYVS